MGAETSVGSELLAAQPPEAAGPSEDRNRLFLRLFLNNQRRLYAYIITLLPQRADADDVLQDASLTMWDKFDATAPPEVFLPWARRVAYHKVLDFYKKSQRAQARLSRLFIERIAEAAAEQADALQLDARRDALAGCLEKLPPRDRELVTHRFADGATTQSTSQQLGCSVDALYKSLAKVRHALLHCIQNSLAREGQA